MQFGPERSSDAVDLFTPHTEGKDLPIFLSCFPKVLLGFLPDTFLIGWMMKYSFKAGAGETVIPPPPTTTRETKVKKGTIYFCAAALKDGIATLDFQLRAPRIQRRMFWCPSAGREAGAAAECSPRWAASRA